MADEKISAMAAATEVANADIMPIVQGGVNLSATRELLLTAAPASYIHLVGNDGTSALTIDSGNTGSLVCAGDVSMSSTPAGALIYADTAGSIGIVCADAGEVFIRNISNTMSLIFDPSSGSWTMTASSTIYIQYTAGSPGNWPSGLPGDVWAALDKIAAAVFFLSGGVYP